ncbi:hypothetical protein LCGC14_1476700 [marine sediment metagenome]|uniref:Uncharacterized protein n=1 Tax=marine sediment metagenome TaxID=412755 RepID=A0A0F9JAS6_9ZZZZ
MSIDTRAKMASIIGLGLPTPSLLPVPDDTIGSADRQHLLWLYSGIDIAVVSAVVRKVIELTVYLYSRVLTTKLYNRITSLNMFKRVIDTKFLSRVVSAWTKTEQ